jgi:hypothetical protein
MGPCICLCLQEPTSKFVLVQKKADAVVTTVDKSVTITCSGDDTGQECHHHMQWWWQWTRVSPSHAVVMTVDNSVTITCSGDDSVQECHHHMLSSAKLTKTAQLFLEPEWTAPPVCTELCPPVARRMRNWITRRSCKIAITAEDVQLYMVHFNTNQSGTILPEHQECGSNAKDDTSFLCNSVLQGFD